MDTAEQTAVDESQRNLEVLLTEPRTQRLLSRIIIINIFILLCRPQVSFSPIGILQLPFLLTIAPLLLTLPRVGELWRMGRPVRALFCMLALGAAWVPLARNNYWALQTLRDVAQQYFCYFFPVMLFMTFGQRMRKLAVCCTVCGIYLAIYSLLHGGVGPGGYLGDENDLCMQLDGLLGIPLLLFPASRSATSKFKKVLGALIILGGIVASWSRGGFVGMMFVVAYMFIKTPYKVQSTLAAVLILLTGVFCVPQSYWKEMGTISDTNEGTAKGRIDVWKIGMRLWLTPRNFVFGVGMQNAPFHTADYEPDVNKSSRGKSVGGRAVHSMWVQLIADLGLSGLLIALATIGGTFRSNEREVKSLRSRMTLLQRYEALQSSSLNAGRSSNTKLGPLLRASRHEIEYLSGFLLGVNACLLGAIGAGTFISAFYYPTVWLLVTLGVAGRNYSKKLLRALDELAASPTLLEGYASSGGREL